MTELYALDRGDERLPETLAERLPPWRRRRFDKLRSDGARQESLWTGLLFAYAMERRGVDPGEPVRLLPAGKPVFAERTDVYFSLSHSGRYILCAVSGAPVGADVQTPRNTRLTVARRFCPAEQAWLSSLPEAERQAGLFRLWTRKEAWVKAVSGERTLALDEADVLRGVPGLTFRDYRLPGGVFAALCTAEDDPPDAPVFPGSIL